MGKNSRSLWILLPVLFLCVSFSNCAGSQISETDIMFEKNPPFTIKEVYFQKWVSGIKEGGSGIRVHFVFQSKDPAVEIKEVFFRNQVQRAHNSENKKNEFIAQFSINPSRDVIMDIDPKKEAVNTPSQNFPFELDENEAVISYEWGNKVNYFKISNLSEKPQIAYPQSNPNNRN